MDELFLIQEESKEMAGMPLEELSEEEQSQIGEVEESFLETNRNSLADETPPDLDADNCPSSVIGEPEKRPLSSSSQLNLEPALKELDSTSIIATSDVPASHIIPCTSSSEKSSNLTTSYHINHSSNTHACKICSFKTPYDSVMVWHLRMHMKSGRWCDFCNVAIPVQESHFLSMKRKVCSGRARRRPIAKSTLPAILPAVPKESSYPFKPLCLPLIPIENEQTSAPVLVITKEPESLQEAVEIPTAIIELPKNFESVESVIEQQCIIESGTVQDKPEVGEEKVLGARIDAQLGEPFCVEEFSRIAESGSERLETVNTIGTIREEFSISISECDNLLEDAAGQDFNTLPNQHGVINDACVPENVGEFTEDGIQVSKSDNLNDREVFCEDSVERSFLDTLSSQQEGKFHEILPEICSESNEQGMMSIASDANLTNKDVSFARSDGLGESELAIAYENSVAALMCQSDDSEGILTYQ
ncbi:hypothetical protein J437_LFUL010261 [Ladona fulva]|uniref:Uncharacterized protein n=1 Tax=Ladona fulva TaxID=123851 RepID=A0A8K0KDB8_LADFU|nr:hypothetical protein J437_LFUL010261 [Ladona fulva]